jgi:hypothetical protein
VPTTLAQILTTLAEVDPLGGLAGMAREGGPWVFIAAVAVGLQWWYARVTIRLYRESANEWRAAYQTEVERGRIRDDQNDKLLTATEAQNRALQSIAEEASKRRGRAA